MASAAPRPRFEDDKTVARSRQTNPAAVAPEGNWDSILEDLNKMRNETSSQMAAAETSLDEPNPFAENTSASAASSAPNPFADGKLDEQVSTNAPNFGAFEEAVPMRPTVSQSRSQHSVPMTAPAPPLPMNASSDWASELPVYGETPRETLSSEGYIEPPVWNRRNRSVYSPLPPQSRAVGTPSSTAIPLMKTASHHDPVPRIDSTTTGDDSSNPFAALSTASAPKSSDPTHSGTLSTPTRSSGSTLKISPGNHVGHRS